MGFKRFMGMWKWQPDRNQEPPPKNEWPKGLTTIGEKEFDDFINLYPVSLIDFYSPSCGPCIEMAPAIRHLALRYKHRVAFAKVNIMEEQELSRRYKIMGVPNIIIFSYGKRVTSLLGRKPESSIMKALDKVLAELDK